LRCIYLVLLFARYFLAAGGDPAWLQGIQEAPVKWRQLLSLNRDLAEKPWLVTSDRVYSLTHRGDSASSRETLSLSELMHAVAIMTHVHALTSFIFGCGILPEIDQNEQVFYQLDPVQPNGLPDSNILSSGSNYMAEGTTPRNGLSDGPDTVGSLNSYSSRRTSTVKNDSGDQELTATQLLHLIQTEDAHWVEVSEDMVAEQFIAVTQLNVQCTCISFRCSL
uniref:Pecanex-like protein n=1 Tax=Echinostoma caproni TaxID=27848 RepID=A0A183BCM2_9TREM